MRCDAENDESAESYEVPLDEVGQLACPPEFVKIQEIPVFL
jgi:hypothetical protein